MSRSRDEAAAWRQSYKAPIPTSTLANRMGSYTQMFTLYQQYRPFGITAIIGGWDSEKEQQVDGQVGFGPSVGTGGKQAGGKHGGPYLYMVEPSGLYWVCAPGFMSREPLKQCADNHRATTAQQQAKVAKPQNPSSKSWISRRAHLLSNKASRKLRASSTLRMRTARTRNLSWR